MARSKSASRKSSSSKTAAPSFDFKSDDVQLAVAIAAVGGLVFATQGNVHTKEAWFGFFSDGDAIPMFSFGTILTTLHVLNSSQHSVGGHWAQRCVLNNLLHKLEHSFDDAPAHANVHCFVLRLPCLFLCSLLLQLFVDFSHYLFQSFTIYFQFFQCLPRRLWRQGADRLDQRIFICIHSRQRS